MSLKIFILALSFISSSFVFAEEQIKSSVNVSFQFPKSDVPNILNEVSAKKFLRNKGILTDELSKVRIHEEQTTINLHCFDCLIVNRGNNVNAIQSDNAFSN